MPVTWLLAAARTSSGASFNGRTRAFEACYRGSNPRAPAMFIEPATMVHRLFAPSAGIRTCEGASAARRPRGPSSRERARAPEAHGAGADCTEHKTRNPRAPASLPQRATSIYVPLVRTARRTKWSVVRCGEHFTFSQGQHNPTTTPRGRTSKSIRQGGARPAQHR